MEGSEGLGQALPGAWLWHERVPGLARQSLPQGCPVGIVLWLQGGAGHRGCSVRAQLVPRLRWRGQPTCCGKGVQVPPGF